MMMTNDEYSDDFVVVASFVEDCTSGVSTCLSVLVCKQDILNDCGRIVMKLCMDSRPRAEKESSSL